MFERLLHWPQTTIENTPSGMVIAKFINEASNALNLAAEVMTTAVRDSLSVLALLGVLMYYNWPLTLLTLVFGPLLGGILRVFSARLRKLKPAEIQGGVTAISNLGMHGVREFAAIINPPHATILAIGAAARRPVETADGGIGFVSQMTVTLSCDHRVIDGALGAELLAAFRHFVEHPVGLMI